MPAYMSLSSKTSFEFTIGRKEVPLQRIGPLIGQIKDRKERSGEILFIVDEGDLLNTHDKT